MGGGPPLVFVALDGEGLDGGRAVVSALEHVGGGDVGARGAVGGCGGSGSGGKGIVERGQFVGQAVAASASSGIATVAVGGHAGIILLGDDDERRRKHKFGGQVVSVALDGQRLDVGVGGGILWPSPAFWDILLFLCIDQRTEGCHVNQELVGAVLAVGAGGIALLPRAVRGRAVRSGGSLVDGSGWARVELAPLGGVPQYRKEGSGTRERVGRAHLGQLGLGRGDGGGGLLQMATATGGTDASATSAWSGGRGGSDRRGIGRRGGQEGEGQDGGGGGGELHGVARLVYGSLGAVLDGKSNQRTDQGILEYGWKCQSIIAMVLRYRPNKNETRGAAAGE